MAKTPKTIRVHRVKGDGENVIDIEVLYRKGGINYFTYEKDPRGYYVYLQAAEAKEDGMYHFAMGNGNGRFLREATRVSKKVILECAESCMDDPAVEACYQALVAKNPGKGFPEWSVVKAEYDEKE